MNINCGHCHNTHPSVADVRTCSTSRKAPHPSSTRRPARRQPTLTYPNNPFFQAHLDAELAYSVGGDSTLTRRQATARVINEFLNSGHPDKAMECGNCRTDGAWWRPTVGAVMCINCRSVRVGRYDKETGNVTISWTKGS